MCIYFTLGREWEFEFWFAKWETSTPGNPTTVSIVRNKVSYYYYFFCRMLTTRNMCMALKDHVSRVEATIERGIFHLWYYHLISMVIIDLEEVDKEVIKANEQDVVNTYQVCTCIHTLSICVYVTVSHLWSKKLPGLHFVCSPSTRAIYKI